MEYRGVDGYVYGRYAITPPVINSEAALRFGVAALSDQEIREGGNVKLRFILENHTRRMTCHAIVDWITRSHTGDGFLVGFGRLSLSDHEFAVLERSFTESGPSRVEFRDSVRDRMWDEKTMPVTTGKEADEVTRIKAVTLPVGLIETIDSRRGDTPFSKFVTEALQDYLNR